MYLENVLVASRRVPYAKLTLGHELHPFELSLDIAFSLKWLNLLDFVGEADRLDLLSDGHLGFEAATALEQVT